MVEALLRILRAQWPGVQPSELLGGGNRNLVLSATLHGKRVVARRTRRTSDALAWEMNLMTVLARDGFLVPRPIPAHDGSPFHDGVCVLTWLDGDPPESDADWRQVATTLRRLHALTGGWSQRPGFVGTTALLEQTTGGDIDLRTMPEDGVVLCRAAWRAIADEPRSVVHGDPGAQNLRLTASGVGILDWDEARVDASVLDLAEHPLAAEFVQPPARLKAAKNAATAWEAANGWLIEPNYARRKLSELGKSEET